MEDWMTALQIFEADAGALVMKPTAPRLDAITARDVRADAVAAAANRSLVVIDLNDVNFIDSTGVGCLVSILKALASGGQVRLVGIQPAVKALLHLTRLDRVFQTFATVDAAIAA